ncbi:MAG: elongation factor P [Candidatus Pacebacteria bacterium]|nr:elongation factor P [Candidatus Paceibacterota bacterium]
MKVSYSNLEKGSKIILNNQPYQIIECSPMFKGRGSSVLRAKIKNLITEEIFSYTFQSSDVLEQAEIEKFLAQFIYSHRDKFVFVKKNKERITLSSDQVKEKIDFLKPNQEVEIVIFKDKIVNINLPIKLQLKVIEAPPGVKGDRSQAGTKLITLETGAKINVPLFIKKGDIIEINTERREYTKRIETE